MTYSLPELARLTACGVEVVRVTIAAVRGPSPREPGADMLVHRAGTFGSVGGGKIEFKALELALEMLDRCEALPRRRVLVAGGDGASGSVELWLDRFTAAEAELAARAAHLFEERRECVLVTAMDGGAGHRLLLTADSLDPREAPEPGQNATLRRAAHELVQQAAAVCLLGMGERRLMLERLARDHTPLWVFGAGHVGGALIRQLAELPFDITWIDSREEMFPHDLRGDVCAVLSDAPEAEVRHAPTGTWFVVLTHSPELDFEIGRAVLKRGDFEFLGMIASTQRAARNVERYTELGLPQTRIARITAPIGMPGVGSKAPAALALSIAAQLMQLRAANRAASAVANALRVRAKKGAYA
ncbi:MAG: XdhC family protein [Rhodocyclaceae bacterium]|nr:XdhC family protein [Rhodocyclaceae bacterium]MBX3667580.1 XdhC family protein [Rhodocyclaceae bacterium]